jgi:hypothetical protein
MWASDMRALRLGKGAVGEGDGGMTGRDQELILGETEGAGEGATCGARRCEGGVDGNGGSGELPEAGSKISVRGVGILIGVMLRVRGTMSAAFDVGMAFEPWRTSGTRTLVIILMVADR